MKGQENPVAGATASFESGASAQRGEAGRAARTAAAGTGGPKWVLPVAVVGLIALIIGGWYYVRSQGVESTDDAFIDGHIIPMSSKVAGQVTSVPILENHAVKKGDLLVEIDPEPYRIQLEEEQAKFSAAQLEARRDAADAARYKELVGKDEVSKQQYEHALTEAEAAKAAVAREKAAVDQAQLNLSYTRTVAPEDGIIARKSVEPGMYVQTGQALLSLVPSELWVTANFKETQLRKLRPGQPVRFTVDAYRGRPLKGHVDSVQPGTGARFSLFPPENATGNFVKIVQRVPVKILIDEPADQRPFLAPGMSVVVEADVR